LKLILTFFALVTLVIGVVFTAILRTGLPMRELRLPTSVLIGSLNDLATDTARPDLFSGAPHRVIPLQILYPASAPGIRASYVPEAGPLIEATAKSHGWISRITLGQIGSLNATWTEDAVPSFSVPLPVIIYLPGVTGYMQMGSFQTTELAALGYVVVSLNQPGVVAAAVMPDHQIIEGMTGENATSLIAPSYRQTDQALPEGFAKALIPEHSIIPYLAADVPLVLDRLAQINANPAHILHGLLDLDHVGVMGMSLGAIVTAQACASYVRIGACLMMDAPVPTSVSAVGLRQPALWISRPKGDQRLERAVSGGWSEVEIDAQAETIDQAISKSEHGRLVQLHGLFHIDFTDLPALQPVFGWFGQSGTAGIAEAHRQINELTKQFFAATIRLKGG
jgi:hypothetical protein